MSAPRSAARLLLTERAIHDIAEIDDYSVSQWGKPAAAKYLAQLEQALVRLQEKPALLRPEPDFHPHLRFYRVNQHLLVCDKQPNSIVLLTVIHANHDIPSRLAEMAPTLATEVELLHRQLLQSRKPPG